MEAQILKTFTQWLDFVEKDNEDLSYFFQDEMSPTELAQQMLQMEKLSFVNCLIVNRMEVAGTSDQDMYKFIKLKEFI